MCYILYNLSWYRKLKTATTTDTTQRKYNKKKGKRKAISK